MNLIAQIEKEEIERLGAAIPDFAAGDTVVVNVNVVEGERKRVAWRRTSLVPIRSNAISITIVYRFCLACQDLSDLIEMKLTIVIRMS